MKHIFIATQTRCQLYLQQARRENRFLFIAISASKGSGLVKSSPIKSLPSKPHSVLKHALAKQAEKQPAKQRIKQIKRVIGDDSPPRKQQARKEPSRRNTTQLFNDDSLDDEDFFGDIPRVAPCKR